MDLMFFEDVVLGEAPLFGDYEVTKEEVFEFATQFDPQPFHLDEEAAKKTLRLGIKPFAELGANSEALSGSQVDSPCSCQAIFESAPVAMLQSRKRAGKPRVDRGKCHRFFFRGFRR